MSCAAVGLLIAVVFRMMMPLLKKRDLVGLVVLVAVFVAIGVLRLPLQAVLLVAIPLSLAITICDAAAGEQHEFGRQSGLRRWFGPSV